MLPGGLRPRRKCFIYWTQKRGDRSEVPSSSQILDCMLSEPMQRSTLRMVPREFSSPMAGSVLYFRELLWPSLCRAERQGLETAREIGCPPGMQPSARIHSRVTCVCFKAI